MSSSSCRTDPQHRTIKMRGRFFLFGLIAMTPLLARARVPTPKSKQDSIARADSIAKADSIALVQQLEKELGAAAGDTGTAAAQPRAPGGYMNIGFGAGAGAGVSP